MSNPAESSLRPLYWSVRREVWENRSIYIAPLIVAAIVLFGSFVSTMTMPYRLRSITDPAKQVSLMKGPYSMAPAPVMLVTFIVGFFYCLDALYGERRDRSILFWKSLPVSDRTTVLSKMSIPMVVLPAIALVLGWTTQFLVRLLGTAVLTGSGHDPARLWTDFFQEPLIQIYGMTVHALWFAPLYAWLLLVSAWARRTPFLWALLPLFAIALIERISFNSSSFVGMLGYRFSGAMQEAFVMKGGNPVDLTPLNYLSSPGLWVGLLFAAACVAAAVRLRRYREPI